MYPSTDELKTRKEYIQKISISLQLERERLNNEISKLEKELHIISLLEELSGGKKNE